MSNYTPTTDRVRGAFQDTWGGSERHGRAFDRWLAARDAGVLEAATQRVLSLIREEDRERGGFPAGFCPLLRTDDVLNAINGKDGNHE